MLDACELLLCRMNEVLGPFHRKTLNTLDIKALCLNQAGLRKEAIVVLHQALDADRATLGPEDPDTIGCWVSLADIYNLIGENSTALKHLESALEVSTKLCGAHHPTTLRILGSLGRICTSTGNHEGAERYARMVLEGYQRTLGVRSRQTLEQANVVVHALFKIPGREAEAQELARDIIEAYEQSNHDGETVPPMIRYLRSYLVIPAGRKYMGHTFGGEIISGNSRG